jgi:hypothetical protein
LRALSRQHRALTPEGLLRTRDDLTQSPPMANVSAINGDFFFVDAIRRYLQLPSVRCTAPVCELEAESAVELGAPLERVAEAPGYVWQAPGGSTTAGRARYRFTVARAGTYGVTMLLNTASSATNTLSFNIDGEPGATMSWLVPPTSGFEARMGSWKAGGAAARPATFALGAGLHTLVVTTTTPRLAIDKIRLVRQTRILEDFSGTRAPLAVQGGQAAPDAGSYRITPPEGGRGLALHETPIDGGFVLALRGRIERSATGGSLAIVFGFRDAANHHVARLATDPRAPGGIYRVAGGVETLLAAAGAPIEAERWYSLTVKTDGGHVELTCNGALAARTSDARVSAGRIGLEAHAAPVRFDDLVVD